MVGVLPMHVISLLFFVIFNLAVPSNQAKLANEGSDGDSIQDANLFLTKVTTEIVERIEKFRNWGFIDTDKLESTKAQISSFFEDLKLNDEGGVEDSQETTLSQTVQPKAVSYF